MRSGQKIKASVTERPAPALSELLRPLVDLWPTDQHRDAAEISDYLYRVAHEQPAIIARLAPLCDASATAKVRACAAARPDLFAQEFAVMRRIVLEALRTEGSGDWGRSYLVINFAALLWQRIELRVNPMRPQQISPFVYAMQ